MIVTSVNNIKFYREFDLCERKDLISIKEAIDLEFAKNNIVWTHPLYQTWSDLHKRLKHVPSFSKLKNKVIKLVKNTRRTRKSRNNRSYRKLKNNKKSLKSNKKRKSNKK